MAYVPESAFRPGEPVGRTESVQQGDVEKGHHFGVVLQGREAAVELRGQQEEAVHAGDSDGASLLLELAKLGGDERDIDVHRMCAAVVRGIHLRALQEVSGARTVADGGSEGDGTSRWFINNPAGYHSIVL